MTQTPWYDDDTSRGFSWTGPGSSGHNGYDVETPYHTPISALYEGVVSYVGEQPGTNGSPGAEVEIQVDDPYHGHITDLYLHLDQVDPALHVGEHVKAGSYLGLSGGETLQQVQADPKAYPNAQHPVINTSSYTYSTGPHTHFGEFNGWAPMGTDAWESINDFLNPAQEIEDARSGKLGDVSPKGGGMNGNTSDPCGPMPSPTDTIAFGAWVACKTSSAANNLNPLTGLEKGITDVLPRIGVGAAGVVLVLLGLLEIGRVIAEPATDAATKVAATAAKAAA